MDFCSEQEYESFFKEVELFESMLVNAGFIILKYYLYISKKEQGRRLKDRKTDPLKQWKISPIDQQAQKCWKDIQKPGMKCC
jgi:polyphosphate kinase 2 (PPK2 family)